MGSENRFFGVPAYVKLIMRIRLRRSSRQSKNLTQIHSAIHVLQQLDYEELLLVNESILKSFICLLDKISRESPTLETIIESFDQMIKRWGKIFSSDLALEFNYLHSFVLKQLTQTQSTKFVSCHIFMTFLIDYLLEVCQK